MMEAPQVFALFRQRRLLHDAHHMMRCGICNGRAINCDALPGRCPGRAIMSVYVWSTPDTGGIDSDAIRGASASLRCRRGNGTSPVSRCNQTFLWLSTSHAVAEIDNQESLRILVMLL
jgi:hypothetical protein